MMTSNVNLVNSNPGLLISSYEKTDHEKVENDKEQISRPNESLLKPGLLLAALSATLYFILFPPSEQIKSAHNYLTCPNNKELAISLVQYPNSASFEASADSKSLKLLSCLDATLGHSLSKVYKFAVTLFQENNGLFDRVFNHTMQEPEGVYVFEQSEKGDPYGFPFKLKHVRKIFLAAAINDSDFLFEIISRHPTLIYFLANKLLSCRDEFNGFSFYPVGCFYEFGIERISVADTKKTIQNILGNQKIRQYFEELFIKDFSQFSKFADNFLNSLLGLVDGPKRDVLEKLYGGRIYKKDFENNVFAYLASFEESFSQYLLKLKADFAKGSFEEKNLILSKLFPWNNARQDELEPTQYVEKMLNSKAFKELMNDEASSEFAFGLTRHLLDRFIKNNFTESFKQLCDYKEVGPILAGAHLPLEYKYNPIEELKTLFSNHDKEFLRLFVGSHAFEGLLDVRSCFNKSSICNKLFEFVTLIHKDEECMEILKRRNLEDRFFNFLFSFRPNN